MPDRHIVDVHVLLVRDTELLLTERRGGPWDRMWHLPSGKLDAGEDVFSAAAREAAEEVGVLRSALSHIFNERNKPSLDILMKIIKRYPNISLDWLLLGIGEMERPIVPRPIQASLFGAEPVEPAKPKGDRTSAQPPAGAEPVLERIVYFYSDGTFKSYLSR